MSYSHLLVDKYRGLLVAPRVMVIDGIPVTGPLIFKKDIIVLAEVPSFHGSFAGYQGLVPWPGLKRRQAHIWAAHFWAAGCRSVQIEIIMMIHTKKIIYIYIFI